MSRAAILALLLGVSGAACAVETGAGKFLPVAGAKLWYTDSGGQGVPVVFLHPGSGSAGVWEPQVAAFTAAGYRVICYDRRGSGNTVSDVAAAGNEGGLASSVQDLQALVAHLQLPSFHLVGSAAGGILALRYAVLHPQQLKSLVVTTSLGVPDEPEVRQFQERIAIPGLKAAGDEYAELGASYRGEDPDGVKRWLALGPKRPPSPLPSGERQNGSQQSGLDYAALRGLHVPTLVMAGGGDILSPPGLMRLWARQLPDHEWIVVEDAGHAVAWERPEAFNAAVLAFLGRHD
ncbi:MAG: alpha/beta hydrolase [Pseudoxanthomonas sp.]